MAFEIINAENVERLNPKTGPLIIAVLDTDADLTNLGTGWCPGSMAKVADTNGKKYQLNASKVWKEV